MRTKQLRDFVWTRYAKLYSEDIFVDTGHLFHGYPMVSWHLSQLPIDIDFDLRFWTRWGGYEFHFARTPQALLTSTYYDQIWVSYDSDLIKAHSWFTYVDGGKLK